MKKMSGDKETHLKQERGYSYTYSDDVYKKFQTIKADDRLRWLNDTNRLLYNVLPLEDRIIWDKFRKGKI